MNSYSRTLLAKSPALVATVFERKAQILGRQKRCLSSEPDGSFRASRGGQKQIIGNICQEFCGDGEGYGMVTGT